MSDWIHCNKCFQRFRPNIKFYVTTCAHLKCELCVSKMGPQNRCLVCSSVCKMVELSENLEPDVMLFFKPAVDALDKGFQVGEFQLNNALSLLKTMTAKYAKLKAELAKTDKEILELQKEQRSLKMMLKNNPTAAMGLPLPSAGGSSSMMSGNTTSSRCLNMTSASSVSCNSFLPFENPHPRTMRRNQPCNSARMMMHRQHPNAMGALPSSPNSSYAAASQGPSGFDSSGSPNLCGAHGPSNLRGAHGPPPARNVRMGPRGNYHHKPR